MPQVYSKRRVYPEGAVYIGRPSIWGNPFTHLRQNNLAEIIVADRDTSVHFFDMLLHAERLNDIRELVPGDTPLRTAEALLERAIWMRVHLEDLKGKDLVCWCAPLACHGDVLLREANK